MTSFKYYWGDGINKGETRMAVLKHRGGKAKNHEGKKEITWETKA
jgi:hypothetical protein